MEDRKNRFYSPLRYPGGKTKLAPFIKSIFYENNMIGIHYIEPYSGGAGVALSLLMEEYVSSVTINDFDRSIYAFWYSIVNHNEKFCEKIETIPLDFKTWDEQKKIQANKYKEDLFSLGFSTFYLNRTNVSGIIKGGIIGGKNQTGKYKMDARFNKSNIIKRIKKIRNYQDRIKVSNQDAKDILASDIDGRFVFLDPPYVKKANKLYMNFYEEIDHREIASYLLSNRSSFHWLLSYDQTQFIENLYQSCKHPLYWKLGYGSSNRSGREYIFASRNLKTEKSRMILNA